MIFKDNVKMVLQEINNRLPNAITVPFDTYQRYKFVSDLISNFKCETILDVGGGASMVKRFLKDKNVLILDLDQGDVIGNGVALPFKDDSFDVTMSLDVLHYVPSEHRDSFFNELVRVGRKYVIITNPFEDRAIQNAERECNEYYRKLYGEDYKWLKKGFHKGLPDLTEVKNHFAEYNVDVYNNGPLHLWIVMLKLHFLLGRSGSILLLPFKYLINLFYNLILYNLTKKKTEMFRKVLLVTLSKGDVK